MSEFLFWCLGIFVGLTWAFSYVSEDQFSKGLGFCQVNGGLKSYSSHTIGNPTVVCINGARFTIKDGDK